MQGHDTTGFAMLDHTLAMSQITLREGRVLSRGAEEVLAGRALLPPRDVACRPALLAFRRSHILSQVSLEAYRNHCLRSLGETLRESKDEGKTRKGRKRGRRRSRPLTGFRG